MINVLLCPVHATSYAKLLKTAELLVEESQVKCEFLVSNAYIASKVGELKEKGVASVVLPYEFQETYFDKFKILFRALLRLACFKDEFLFLMEKKGLIKGLKLKFFYLRRQEKMKLEYEKRVENVRLFLDASALNVVVLPDDRHIAYVNIILAQAKKRGIRCVIPPISISVNPQDFARQKSEKGESFHVTDNMFFQEKWSNQCYQRESGEVVTFFEFWRVRVLNELGVLPPRPWNIGAGLSDLYMVGGEVEAARHIGNGLDKTKIMVTGDPEYDELFSAYSKKAVLKRQLSEKYGLDADKKVVLVSLPQLFEHGLLPYDEHMGVINTICEAAKKANANVLISLHPKMTKENYSFLESDFGFVVLQERLAEVMPVADVFIASQGSSTWIWSILCEVPMLVCDWYGFDSDISSEEYGLRIIKKAERLEPLLLQILYDEQFRGDMLACCREARNKVGKFDGLCGERVVRQILLS